MRGEQERHKQEHADERRRFKRASADVASSGEESMIKKRPGLLYTPSSAVQDSENVCRTHFQRKNFSFSLTVEKYNKI